MFALPVDPRVIEAYGKQTDSFQKAAALFEPPIEILKIPYENTTLPGYFIKPDESEAARKTLLCTGGYDGTCEELFFNIGGGALERGYNVLIFDGPGQGGARTIFQQTAREYDSTLYSRTRHVGARRGDTLGIF